MLLIYYKFRTSDGDGDGNSEYHGPFSTSEDLRVWRELIVDSIRGEGYQLTSNIIIVNVINLEDLK